MNKGKLNFWFDLLLFVLLVLTVVSLCGAERAKARDREPAVLQTSIVVHSVAGALMLIGSGVHIALHITWIMAVVNRPPRRLTGRVRARRRIDIWLFVLAVLCGVTGMMALLMCGTLPDPFALSLRAWSGLHRLTGTAMLLLRMVHLVQHLRWIMSAPRRYLKTEVRSRGRQPEQVPT